MHYIMEHVTIFITHILLLSYQLKTNDNFFFSKFNVKERNLHYNNKMKTSHDTLSLKDKKRE